MQQSNIKELLAQWLAQGNQRHRELLNACHIDVSPEGELTIDCQRHLIDQLVDYSQELGWLAPGNLINQITLLIEGELETSFYPSVARQYPLVGKEPVDLFGLQLAAKLDWKRNGIAVVEMGTDIGIFCTTRINAISRIPDDRWRNNDMRTYHIPEEYQRFINQLETHKAFQGFEYHALNFDGERYWQRVNGYLGYLGKRQVRVIEVVDHTVVG